MPALGDFLGALLSEITKARVLADLETARVAELYASDPLLHHMPVPRFRLPTVTIDLPIGVEKVEPVAVPSLASQIPALRQALDKIVANQLTAGGLHLTPSRQKRLTQDLSDLLDGFQASAESISAEEAAKAAGDAAGLIVEAIKASTPERATVDPSIESSLHREVSREFLRLQPPPPRIQTLIVTAQLKDLAPPLVLTRVQLTISEEGVEWSQTKPDDPTSKTLLPE